MKNKNVLISGAGIGGLTLAYWLKKYGFNPTIVEKYPVLRANGYKIDIRGAALDVIKHMGVKDAISKASTEIQKALFVDSSGKILSEVTPDLCGARAEGDLEIVRGDLCQILFDQLNDVEIIFGDSIKNISQDESGVSVEFEKSKPRQFDLVVGADGLHSKVRSLSFGDESNFIRESGIYISFYSIPNFLHLDRVEIEYYSPRRFAIVYCPKDGMAKACFAFSSPPINISDQNQQKIILKEAFKNSRWEIPKLLDYMDDAKDFYFDCAAQIHMPSWTNGRITLVGDAGYAVSPLAGQGSSVALIGAYVLAYELSVANGNYKVAFQQYEKELSEFVKKNQSLTKMSITLMGGKGGALIASILIRISNFLGKILPSSWIKFCKNCGLRNTTKAANAIVIKSRE